jgi:hypothetical protein
MATPVELRMALAAQKLNLLDRSSAVLADREPCTFTITQPNAGPGAALERYRGNLSAVRTLTLQSPYSEVHEPFCIATQTNSPRRRSALVGELPAMFRNRRYMIIHEVQDLATRCAGR